MGQKRGLPRPDVKFSDWPHLRYAARAHAGRKVVKTMKFRCEHRFNGIGLADYEQLYFDEDFNIALCGQVGLQRTLLSREIVGGKIHRVVKVAPERQIPPAAAKILGSAKIEYTETVDYVFGSGRGTWFTVSSLMTEKVDCRGSVHISGDSGYANRVIEGDVTVKLTFVGGVVEKFIIDDVQKSYDKAAEFTRNWLAKK